MRKLPEMETVEKMIRVIAGKKKLRADLWKPILVAALSLSLHFRDSISANHYINLPPTPIGQIFKNLLLSAEICSAISGDSFNVCL